MPIPVRTQPRSPSKADKAGERPPSSPAVQVVSRTTLSNTAANATQLSSQAKANVAPSTTTSSKLTGDPRPGIPRIAAPAGKAAATAGHIRSLSAASSKTAQTKDASFQVSRASSRKADVGAPAMPLHSKTLNTSTRSTPHSRTLSASTRIETGSRNLPATNPKAVRPTPREPTVVTDKPTFKKPDFNNYKQHYSPKKTQQALPPTPAPVRSGSGDGSAESRRLQEELLQLALLYERSQSTLQSYRESIELQLAAWSDDLKQRVQTLDSLEGERQNKVNADAINAWMNAGERPGSAGSAGLGLKRLTILAHSIRELRDITERHGPLETALRQFDEWQISATVRAPNGTSLAGADGISLDLLAPLDSEWAALVASVQKRVGACRQSLANIQGPAESSSIGLLINMHFRLADGILQEIAVCKDVEGLILQQAQASMEAAVTRALSEAESHDSGQLGRLSERKGIWDTPGKLAE